MGTLYRRTIPALLLCTAPFGVMAQDVDPQLKKYLTDAQNAPTEKEFVAAMNSADSFARKKNDVASQAKINRNFGGYYYDKDADKSIKYMQKAHQLFLASGNKKDAALCLNNIAFAYQEQKEDMKEALNYSRKAINAHTELNDTPGMANVYKFQAVVYAKMREFANGKKSATKAIQLFTAKNNMMGVAVSYRDMGIVYEEERSYDSAIAWLLRAKEIWNRSEYKEKNGWRVYGINTDLARIYTSAKRPDDAASVIQENEAYTMGVHYSDKLRFYKESREHYKKLDKEKAGVYKEKYTVLRDSLEHAGVNVKD